MFHIFFIHSSVNKHLGCFHIWAIVNSAAVDIEGACIFLNYGFLQVLYRCREQAYGFQGEVGLGMDWDRHIYTTMYKIDKLMRTNY